MLLNPPFVETATQLCDDDVTQLAALSALCFPDVGRPVTAREAEIRAAMNAHPPDSPDEMRFYLIRRQGVIIAGARMMPRLIAIGQRLIQVTGLCGVMAHPEVRGQGLGKTVVRKAFESVDEGEFPFSLFQTRAARPFYEKLGCRLVTDPVFNSLNSLDPRANPLWDPWLMRYPGEAAWPDGEIDLLGPAW